MIRAITAACTVILAAFFVLLVFVTPQTVTAQETFNSQTGVKGGPCTSLADMAGIVMSARQLGMPMSQAWSYVQSVKLYEAIVIAAYDEPLQTSRAEKEAAVDRFMDSVFSTCVQTLYFDEQ